MKTFKDFRKIPGLKGLQGPRGFLYEAYDKHQLNNPEQLAELFIVLDTDFGIVPRWTEWARLLQEPIDMSGLSRHPDYDFYQALLKPKFDFLNYLRELTDSQSIQLCSNTGNLALAYLFAGREAWEFLFMRLNPALPLSAQLKLTNWALEDGHLDALNFLIDMPEIMAHVIDNAHMVLCKPATNGHALMLDRLLEIPVMRAAAADHHNLILRYAAEQGHLAAVEVLLRVPEVLMLPNTTTAAVTSAINKFHHQVAERLCAVPEILKALSLSGANHAVLTWAAGQGLVSLIELMLELPGFVESAALYNNDVLFFARKCPVIINRLLRLPKVRQTHYAEEPASKPNALHTGIVRALWLDLQETPDFNGIQTIAALKALAKAYLSGNQNWRDMSAAQHNRLLESLENQILSLGYYNPLLKLPQMTTNSLLQESLTDAVNRKINEYSKVRESLCHFKEPSLSASHELALNCLKQWSIARKVGEKALSSVCMQPNRSFETQSLK